MKNGLENNFPIIDHLSEDSFIKEEKLSEILLTSIQDIKKQILQLKELGYEFCIDGQGGYRIINRPDILLPFEIKRNLTTRYIGKNIFYFTELTSTNSIASELLRENTNKIPEGTIVIAEKQSVGKGRSGKKWFSPAGGIWLSVVLYPELDPSHMSFITLMTAVAVVKAIEKLLPKIELQIKWPNDILISGRKVCGILTEMSTEGRNIRWVIVGIGINVNNCSFQLPRHISNDSISLKETVGHSVSRLKLLNYLCSELEKSYWVFKEKGFSEILEEWKSYNNIIGKYVEVNSGNKIITGRAIDINEKGALIIKTKDEKIKEIISGTISTLTGKEEQGRI